jgi:hypothetical protein
MRSGQRETLLGARGLEYIPALRRERYPRGGAQSRVIVRDENGRRVGTSSSAARAETYWMGLNRGMCKPTVRPAKSRVKWAFSDVLIRGIAIPLRSAPS